MDLFRDSLGAVPPSPSPDELKAAKQLQQLPAWGRNLDNLTAAIDSAAARLGDAHPTVRLARQRLGDATVQFGNLCDTARAAVAEALRRGLITAEQAAATERHGPGLSAAAPSKTFWATYAPVIGDTIVAAIGVVLVFVIGGPVAVFLGTITLFIAAMKIVADTAAPLIAAGGFAASGAVAIIAIAAFAFFALSGRKGRA